MSVARGTVDADGTGRPQSAERHETRFRIYAYTLGVCAATVVAWHGFVAQDLIRSELLPVLVFSM